MKFKSILFSLMLLMPLYSLFSMQPERNRSRGDDFSTPQAVHTYNLQRYQTLIDSIFDMLDNMGETANQRDRLILQQGWLLIMHDIEKKYLKILKLERKFPLQPAKISKARHRLQELQDELYKYEAEHSIDEELKVHWLENL